MRGIKLKIFTMFSTLLCDWERTLVHTEAEHSYFHYLGCILIIPCLLFFCSFGDMPESATPFFEDSVAGEFLEFKTSFESLKIELASEDITTSSSIYFMELCLGSIRELFVSQIWICARMCCSPP